MHETLASVSSTIPQNCDLITFNDSWNSFSFTVLCDYLHVVDECVHLCIRVLVPMCKHVEAKGHHRMSSLYCSLPYFFKAESLTESGAYPLARLVSQGASGSVLCPPS